MDAPHAVRSLTRSCLPRNTTPADVCDFWAARARSSQLGLAEALEIRTSGSPRHPWVRAPVGIAGALGSVAGARSALVTRSKLTARARFASLGRSKLAARDRFGFAVVLKILHLPTGYQMGRSNPLWPCWGARVGRSSPLWLCWAPEVAARPRSDPPGRSH